MEWFLKLIHANCSVSFKTTVPNNFRDDFTKWLVYNKISDFDTIYILDLDVSENCDLIDYKNITIIDHHQQSNKNAQYKNATSLIKEYTSACKLIYNLYSKKYPNIKFNDKQKLLILLTDDYDSYTLKHNQSKILNSVLWGSNNRFETFYNSFKDGFSSFTQQQLNIHKLAETEIKKEVDNISLFRNKNITIDNNVYDVMATYITNHVNEVADIIIKKYSPDLLFLINTKKHNINIRGKATNIDYIAKTICDGGGHKYAGGGVLTKQFLQLSKQLLPFYE